MWLRHHDPTLAEEPRYDAVTLRKVARLAQRLQDRQQETLTAREMESIGAEVGLDPTFMRRALAQLTAPPSSPPPPKQHLIEPELADKIATLWWAVGWSIIPVTAILHMHAVALAPFLYVVIGITLSIFLGD